MAKKSKLTKPQKKRLYSIISGAVLFVAGTLAELLIHGKAGEIASGVIFAAAAAAAGYTCVIKAVRRVAAGEFFDENMLMTIAAIGALVIGEYPECAAVMILYQTGELLQSIAVGRSRRAIAALGDIRPDHATVIRGGAAVTIPSSEIREGDVLRISAGERIAADCVVVSGTTAVDTSAVTGESIPRDATTGDELLSGCINLTGQVDARALRAESESTAARILAITEDAAGKKSRPEAFITKFAKIYTPAVTILALLLALVPPTVIAITGGSFKEALRLWGYRGISALVISCPCALVISVPLGYFCGMGKASSLGILIKGSGFMDQARDADILLLDKTGTVTEGHPVVTDIICAEGIDESYLLTLAASAEAGSSHPIASAILAAAAERNLTVHAAESITEAAGHGVSATVDGRDVTVGRIGGASAFIDEVPAGSTAVEVSIGGNVAGVILLTDKVRADFPDTMAALRRLGIKKIVMLTGDGNAAGRNVAARLGFDEAHCELLPENKLTLVEEYKKEGKVMYCGDGINDSPALAGADIGIAMGASGSDAAMEAADIVLMNSAPAGIRRMVEISRHTGGVVRANIVLSIAVKIAVLALTSLGVCGMWAAVVADVGVCMAAVLNSVRLLRMKNV